MANKCLLREHSTRRIFDAASKAVVVQRLARALVLESFRLRTKTSDWSSQAQAVLDHDIQSGLTMCPLLARKTLDLRRAREKRRWGAAPELPQTPPDEELKEEGFPSGSLNATFCELQNLLGLEADDENERKLMLPRYQTKSTTAIPTSSLSGACTQQPTRMRTPPTRRPKLGQ